MKRRIVTIVRFPDFVPFLFLSFILFFSCKRKICNAKNRTANRNRTRVFVNNTNRRYTTKFTRNGTCSKFFLTMNYSFVPGRGTRNKNSSIRKRIASSSSPLQSPWKNWFRATVLLPATVTPRPGSDVVFVDRRVVPLSRRSRMVQRGQRGPATDGRRGPKEKTSRKPQEEKRKGNARQERGWKAVGKPI